MEHFLVRADDDQQVRVTDQLHLEPVLDLGQVGAGAVVEQQPAVPGIGDGGVLIDYQEYFDMRLSYVRARIEMEHWIESLLNMRDSAYRTGMANAARQKALEYEWESIVPLWTDLFDRIITTTSGQERWKRSMTL